MHVFLGMCSLVRGPESPRCCGGDTSKRGPRGSKDAREARGFLIGTGKSGKALSRQTVANLFKGKYSKKIKRQHSEAFNPNTLCVFEISKYWFFNSSRWEILMHNQKPKMSYIRFQRLLQSFFLLSSFFIAGSQKLPSSNSPSLRL